MTKTSTRKRWPSPPGPGSSAQSRPAPPRTAAPPGCDPRVRRLRGPALAVSRRHRHAPGPAPASRTPGALSPGTTKTATSGTSPVTDGAGWRRLLADPGEGGAGPPRRGRPRDRPPCPRPDHRRQTDTARAPAAGQAQPAVASEQPARRHPSDARSPARARRPDRADHGARRHRRRDRHPGGGTWCQARPVPVRRAAGQRRRSDHPRRPRRGLPRRHAASPRTHPDLLDAQVITGSPARRQLGERAFPHNLYHHARDDATDAPARPAPPGTSTATVGPTSPPPILPPRRPAAR